jgi:hypothetical protein
MSMNFFLVFSLGFQSQYDTVKCRLRLYTKIVENNGVEPLTSCVQGRRSSQLS